jgi:hypothetical protein
VEVSIASDARAPAFVDLALMEKKMSYSTILKLLSLAILEAASLHLSVPASARECRFFGTPPFCVGDCPAGWEYTGKRVPCWTGSMRLCCRPCGPAQWGKTADCPYPGFSTRPPPPPQFWHSRIQCEQACVRWPTAAQRALCVHRCVAGPCPPGTGPRDSTGFCPPR